MRTMYKTWMSGAKEPTRLYFKNGVFVAGDFLSEGTPDISIVDQIFNNNNLASCSIRYTGQRKREERNKGFVPPQFRGIQNVSDVIKEKTIIDETGVEVKAPKPKREKAIVDPALIADMKRYAEENKTITETAKALEMPYAKIAVLAKKNGITFKAGIKGRQSKGPKKSLDPELIAKVKACVVAGKTVSQTTKELGVPWFEIVKIAKAENLTFVKGQRGKKKSLTTNPA